MKIDFGRITGYTELIPGQKSSSRKFHQIGNEKR
jgi:hypothetical protein